jgi:hypothetical protein
MRLESSPAAAHLFLLHSSPMLSKLSNFSSLRGYTARNILGGGWTGHKLPFRLCKKKTPFIIDVVFALIYIYIKVSKIHDDKRY